jgi:hypothetical protein
MAMAAVGEHDREVADAARGYPIREKRLVVPERALAVSNLYRYFRVSCADREGRPMELATEPVVRESTASPD